MAANTSRENGKKGGRPPGKRNAKTLEREAILEAYRQRSMQVIQPLQDSQLALARGVSYLMVIKTIEIKGKKGRVKRERQRPELVKDPDTIAEYLNGELNDEDDEYYYITTEKPDGTVIENVLDRTFGRSKATVELGGPGGKPLPKTTIRITYPNGYQRNSLQTVPKAS